MSLKPESKSNASLSASAKSPLKWYQISAQIKNLTPQTRGLLIWNLVYLVGGLSCYKLGQRAADVLERVQGPGTWKTWEFLGNSGRSPMFMHRRRPWAYDIEGRQEYERTGATQWQEICTTYKLFQFQNGVHPQRETCDYALVNDALYRQDLDKLLEEQRHEMAIECVQKGVYKDVIEAKQMQRQKRIQYSDYKYKHLLYRE